MNADERLATAYHEAGHAVMGLVCGSVPTAVDITPDADGNAGHSYFGDDVVPESYKRYLNDSTEKRHYAEARVLRALAGTAAHDLLCPGRKHDCGDLRDEQRATQLIRELMSWEGDRDAALGRLKGEARRKLEENWSMVNAIASVLLMQDKISSSDIQSLRRNGSGQA